MLREVYQSIVVHKSRSVLIGLGVAWGIFMIIILVGFGNGFEAGLLTVFDGFNKKSAWVYCGQTSEPFRGFNAGRRIQLVYPDLPALRASVREIENISPEAINWTGSLISYNNHYDRVNIKGVDPEYFNIKLLKAASGRTLNYLDIHNNRRVVLIGKKISETLFEKTDPIGQYINIDNSYFLVIGLIENNVLNSFEAREVYIPYQVFSSLYSNYNGVQTFVYSVRADADQDIVESKIRSALSKRYYFKPTDLNCLYFNRLSERVKMFEDIFRGLRYFLWSIGISALLSGIIGIGNMMFVIVKERTKEIGIRKVLGSSLANILWIFGREFTRLLLFAFAIASPIAWWLMNNWLQDFKYHININVWTFVLAIVITAIIAMATIGYQSIRAASMNPVKSLRSE